MELKTLGRLLAAAALLAGTAADAAAQSAVYACGHIRRDRGAIERLRQSGYTTAILFNVNVEPDGSLATDFTWSTQTAAEAGGIICRDGEYVFDDWCPEYRDDVASLLQAPTSIDRLEICIGGWGNGSYGNIRDLVDRDGTGPETILYRNFKALHEALPGVCAVNNDQEQDYDLGTAVAFHRMLAEIGLRTTAAPYTRKQYWIDFVTELNQTPGTVDVVYLQTYGGGANNSLSDWQVFGDVPVHVGFDCESSANMTLMERNMKRQKNAGAAGGFLWNYNSEERDHNRWASCINRIFGTRTAAAPVAAFSSAVSFGGYTVTLDEGRYTASDLALHGLAACDIRSASVTPGYTAVLYATPDLTGEGTEIEGDRDDCTEAGTSARSLEIKRSASAAPVGADDPGALRYTLGGMPLTGRPAAGTPYVEISNGRAATRLDRP